MSKKSAEVQNSKIKATMRFEDGRRETSIKLLNISLGGVFVALEDPPAFGKQLSVEFGWGGGRHSIKCEGFVVWNTAKSPDKAPGLNGFGVRLSNLGIADMRALSEIIGVDLAGLER